jgi:hypothetical protein
LRLCEKHKLSRKGAKRKLKALRTVSEFETDTKNLRGNSIMDALAVDHKGIDNVIML